MATPTVTVERLEGADRYETSAAVAMARCNGVPVLASGESYADALTATGLANYFHTVLLLVPPDTLHPAVKAALDHCLPEGSTDPQLTIVGGTAAVSTNVERELMERGYDVSRVAGADRYETALRVGQQPGEPLSLIHI